MVKTNPNSVVANEGAPKAVVAMLVPARIPPSVSIKQQPCAMGGWVGWKKIAEMAAPNRASLNVLQLPRFGVAQAVVPFYLSCDATCSRSGWQTR